MIEQILARFYWGNGSIEERPVTVDGVWDRRSVGPVIWQVMIWPKRSEINSGLLGFVMSALTAREPQLPAPRRVVFQRRDYWLEPGQFGPVRDSDYHQLNPEA